MGYTFPGNIRELENIIERAVALTDCDHIRPQDLPQDIQHLEFDTIEGEGLLPLDELEKRYIARVLETTGFNKGLTAQILEHPPHHPLAKTQGIQTGVIRERRLR